MAHQAPLSMRFPKLEYWSGLPLPSPGDLPNPGIKAMSPVLETMGFPGCLDGKESACSVGDLG